MKLEASSSAAEWVIHTVVILLRQPWPRTKMLQDPGERSTFHFTIPPKPCCSQD